MNYVKKNYSFSSTGSAVSRSFHNSGTNAYAQNRRRVTEKFVSNRQMMSKFQTTLSRTLV